MIREIFLRNFKCFESDSIPFRELTLLAGLNGMGKSSVVQSLLLLRQSYLDGVLPKTGLELNGSLVQLGRAKDVFYEDAQGDEFEIAIAWSEGVRASFVLHYHRESDVLRLDAPSIARECFDLPPFTDLFHYLRAERLGPRTANSASDFHVREHRQIGSSGEYAEHYLYEFGDETVDEQLLHGKGEATNLRSQVQAWLHEVSPGTRLHLEIHRQMDIVNLQYSFVTGDDRSNEYRSTSVGFGITYVLPVLIAALSARPGSILIVENPEAHLHPQGQARMGELLARVASTGVQVIVETHSDHVLNGLRLAVHGRMIDPERIAMHFFSRKREAGRTRSTFESPTIDKDGRLDRWPDGFFDEWDKSLERLLSPARQGA
jgi:predicted ATPase